MLFRPVRRLFDDAYEERVELDQSKSALARHLKVTQSQITSEYQRMDKRNNWGPSFIIMVDGIPEGYTNASID